MRQRPGRSVAVRRRTPAVVVVICDSLSLPTPTRVLGARPPPQPPPAPLSDTEQSDSRGDASAAPVIWSHRLFC